MYIAFEGLDGCGKTTQINMLKRYHISNLTFTREPYYFNSEIKKCLLDTKYKSSIAHTLLFLGCHAEHMANWPDTKFIISDRSLFSTLAYTYGYSGELLEKVKNILRMLKIGIYPDKVFYLKIPVQTSISRCKNRGHRLKKDQIEKRSNAYFSRVATAFDNLSSNTWANDARWVVIDATKPPSTIHDIVMKTLAKEIL